MMNAAEYEEARTELWFHLDRLAYENCSAGLCSTRLDEAPSVSFSVFLLKKENINLSSCKGQILPPPFPTLF